MLEVIDRDPRAAFRRLGLSPGRITEAIKSWDGLRSSRALHLLLAPHGLAWLVARIEKHYGPRAHRVVRERPYDLTSVFGVGFQTADTIARSLDVAADSPARTRAGVLHVLSEAERAGSTCLPVAELAARAGELLGTAPDAARLSEMAGADELVSRSATTTRSGPTGPRSPGSSATSRRSCASWRPRRRASRARDRPGDADRLAGALSSPSRDTTRRRPRPGPRAVGRGPRRVRLPALGRHRWPGHRQDRDDPADLRRRERAEGVRPPRRPDRPRRAPDVRVQRPRRLDRPLRARLDPRPGPDRRRARGRPPDRRRDLDGQPRAARHAAPRRRPATRTSSSSATPTSSRRSAPASRSPSSSRPSPSRSPSSPTSSARPRAA